MKRNFPFCTFYDMNLELKFFKDHESTRDCFAIGKFHILIVYLVDLMSIAMDVNFLFPKEELIRFS